MSAAGEWDVYRDADGKPVTITPEQMKAINHALIVRMAVCSAEGQAEDANMPAYLLCKSRLLGRMLIDGRPPLPEKPPHVMGACAYHEVEPSLKHWYWHGDEALAPPTWGPLEDDCPICGTLYKLCPHSRPEVDRALNLRGVVPQWP